MPIGVLGSIGLGLDVIGRVQSGKAARRQRRREARAAEFEAGQLEILAGQDIAVSQRAAMEERRLGRLRSSRALALAAASGGGASDPTVVDIISDLDADATFRANLALFSGKSKARLRRAQAVGLRLGGKSLLQVGQDEFNASLISAAGTIFTGIGSLRSKYGSFDEDA